MLEFVSVVDQAIQLWPALMSKPSPRIYIHDNTVSIEGGSFFFKNP